MENMINMIKRFYNENKGFALSMLFIVLLLCYVAIPTLSEENNTSSTYTIVAWDGVVAESYDGGTGTEDDPYIISNGSELAYFALQLESNSYDDKYFVLENDIILNDGIFSYTEEYGIKYLKDNVENVIEPGVENDIVNVFQSLDNFNGTFDGGFHTIYGLYIDDAIDGQNGLFTNLSGNVSNLYVKNSLIYGGNIVGGVVSKAINSSLTNISYDGYVISDADVSVGTSSINLNDIEINTYDYEMVLELDVSELNYIPGIVTSVILSGVSDTILKINGEEINVGNFELDLGDKVISTISLTGVESGFTLSDLNYEVSYNYGNAAGVISIAEDTNLKNIINKSNVIASVNASGIVNVFVGESVLKNSYNVGLIESDNRSSGLISSINFNNENITIINCYNDGVLNSNNNSMIGNIENNSGSVTLTNVFNAQDEYVINVVSSSNVYVNNSYVISDKSIKDGLIDGEFIFTNLEDLKNKAYVKGNLNYEEYNDSEDIIDNVWVWSFDNDVLPILYIDELNEPIANIYITDYVWDGYKQELDTLEFTDKLVFGIDDVNILNPVKEIYYYISNEKNALTKVQLDSIVDWNEYEEIVSITDEGFYVIYAKIIDNSDNIIYLNTDLLVIDFTSPLINITSSFSENVWNNFRTDLDNYYVNDEITININAEDSMSGISKIYYYLSDSVISNEDIEEIVDWNEYIQSISITDSKTIVYVMVVDNCGNKTYANSDLIIINGYVLKSISPGMNGEVSDNLFISSKSSVALNFVYNDTNEYSLGSSHQLVSNVLLPMGTKITLIDKVKNKVYVYLTTGEDYGYNNCDDTDICEATYDFGLFNEIGSNVLFDEINYSGEINEDFIVLVDFVGASISDNIENISLSLRIDNEVENEIRDTLLNLDKKFNVICENSDASFTLSSTFNDTIIYNENAQYVVDFATKLNYQTLLDNNIFDTSFEDKNIGLSIKMVDSNDNVIDKRNLKNIVFMYGDKKYSPTNDGIIRINLENGINDVTGNLIIQTYSDNYSLESGNYKFVISLYTAYDGLYSNEILSSIEIPVYVGENVYNNDINFNVVMDNDDKIVITNENEFNFEILLSEANENINIKMSLYKKDLLSAYDQRYTIIDIGKYIIDNNFEKDTDNVYYALKDVSATNNLNININTSLLEKSGYMFVFELYEDGEFVNRINKKFIVK